MGSLPANIFNPLDSKEFADESKQVIDFIADYYKNIEKYPVRSNVTPGYLPSLLPSSAPYCSESLEDILKDVTDCIIPGITHWQSPNYFGYFPASASTAGFVGEMLCSGFNVVGFNWIASPAATELETIVMDWVGKMLKLPSSFLFSGNGGGILHGTTCEALVCMLAAARDRVLAKIGLEKITKLVVYASDQAHFSVEKAAKLIGIPSSNFRALPTTSATGFSLAPETLRAAVEADLKAGLIPLFLCATIGTTAACAVDPIEELGKIANEHNIWFHVDAAYAGSACICPEFRHFLDGIELADSFTMNLHKWFLTNTECCCLWIKNPQTLTDSLSADPEYLRYTANESKQLLDYKDWQIALSRRFKAIRLWVVLRRQGLANLMYHIRSDVAMAKRFEEMVVKDKRFEIVVPRHFALICFRLKPKLEREGWKLNQKLLEAINSSGRAFLTHGVVAGVFFIRCCVGSTLTEERHVEDLWKLIQEKAQILLKQEEKKSELYYY